MSLAGPARHLGDRDAARGPAAGPHLRRPLRRGAGRPGDRARGRARRARPSSSTTGSRLAARRWPSGLRSLLPRGALRRGPRPDGRAGARGDDARLRPRRVRLPGLDDDHRVRASTSRTANTLIVERADQLGLAQAYQIRGRVGRSRDRAYAYMLYPSPETLTRRRGGPAGDPLRQHRARLRLPGRDARPRDPRAPATCSATSSRATSPPSASSSTARCSRTRPRRSRQGIEEGEGLGPEREPVRVELDVDAYVPERVHPVRGGEDRRPPPRRRRPRAGGAAGPARRAGGPLRPGARARSRT